MRTPGFLYFDLGNVLLKFDHRLAARQMAELADYDEQRVWDLVFGSDLEMRYEAGEISDREFHAIFCRHTERQVDFDALMFAASAIFTPNWSIFPLVAALHGAGYRMGVLSNTCGAHWQYCAGGRYGLISQAFEVFALSYELRACKPEERIYAGAARLAGVPAEEIFFVDDMPANVEGALRAGYDAVLYSTTKRLVEDLRERGLKFNF